VLRSLTDDCHKAAKYIDIYRAVASLNNNIVLCARTSSSAKGHKSAGTKETCFSEDGIRVEGTVSPDYW